MEELTGIHDSEMRPWERKWKAESRAVDRKFLWGFRDRCIARNFI